MWERILVSSTNWLVTIIRAEHEYAWEKRHYLLITQAAGHRVSTCVLFPTSTGRPVRIVCCSSLPTPFFWSFSSTSSLFSDPMFPFVSSFLSCCDIYINAGERGGEWRKPVGSMNEESQVSGWCNFYLHQPGNSVGSPLNQTQPGNSYLTLNDDLILRGHWGKEDAAWQVLTHQIIRAIKLQPNQKRTTGRKKVKGSWPGTHTVHSVTLI